ncbi:hypothetical protein AQUCO_04700085v1 [Aquilegia coerulea]|uniref:Uncharacterized protein n=1 Tax=Aquilegia coerulea TaxID=218851 RepID=A0A2G5CL45_AQUCA|nr:hypothetical protein AQUCO_04700085v1 [Aquilegia coerulea]
MYVDISNSIITCSIVENFHVRTEWDIAKWFQIVNHTSPQNILKRRCLKSHHPCSCQFFSPHAIMNRITK